MKKLLPSLYMILTVLMVGCQMDRGAVPARQVSPTMLASIPTLITPASSLTPAATATFPLSTPPTNSLTETATPAPTETPLFPPEAGVQFQCVKVLSTPTELVESNGIIILDSLVMVDGRYTGDVFLLDLATMESVLLSGDSRGAIYFTVSPDRKLMAYDNTALDTLDIADADGEVLKAIPWEEGWTGIPGWLDDEWLMINLSGLDPLESAHRKPAHLLALNPFTGERKVLAPDYPAIHTFDMFDWAGWSRTMYDPTLTRVVYLTEYDDFSYVLWDLENNREITRLPARIPMWRYIPIPRWFPDGARFVVEAWIPAEERLELFQVSRDGEAEQLTHLYPYGEATLAQYSWSPDGRYLAGLLDTGLGLNPELELVVLDTETRQITNSCLKITYFHEASKLEDSYSNAPPLPIWSPDGTQLLLMNRTGRLNWEVILVDLVRGIAVPIAENMEPKGWMVAP